MNLTRIMERRALLQSRTMLSALLLTAMLFASAVRAQAQYNYIYNLTLNPASVVGGNSSIGTVYLSSPAGSGGQLVSLTATSVASVPASVTVAAGQSSATFTITTSAPPGATNSTITAMMTGSYGYNSSRSANLAISPSGGGGGGAVTLQSITFSPTSVAGGQPVQATVTLTGPAPSGGYVVSLSASNNSAVALGTNTQYVVNATPFPTSVTLAAGQSSVSVYLNTSTVNYPQPILITAANAGQTSSVSGTLTLQPANLRVTDYMLPKAFKLRWDAPSQWGYYTLVRTLMTGNPPTRTAQSTTVATVPAGTMSYTDSFNIINGTAYLYELFDSTGSGNTTTFLSRDVVSGFADSVTENQTIDSRLDLRYSDVHYQDFKFGTRTYRGGLFAGYAAPPDRSNVARSFAKFTVSPPPAGTNFRAGDVNLYSTGSPNNVTNLPVGCQAIANSDWSSPDLVWTLSPLVNPGSATVTASVNWNRSAPTPQWTAWPLSADIRAAAQRAASGGDARLSVAVGAPNETNAGWAYFAKKEYDPTLVPAVTHVWDWSVPIRLFVCGTNIVMNGQIMTSYAFTILVNGLNPGDTVTLPLSITQYSGSINCPPTQVTMNATVTSLINTFQVTLPSCTEAVQGMGGMGTGTTHYSTIDSVSRYGVIALAEAYPPGFNLCGSSQGGGGGTIGPVMPPGTPGP